ncbi:MAG TPA: GDSL-type esterase/lipase family protein [Acidocella sp.]|jgi:lysophospholipase L1-like esterase|nr:GDSL-type esterase/lipase family protein [Acidocella sp.]
MRRLLVLLLLLLPCAAQAQLNLATAPIDRLYLPWWQARWHATLEEARATPDSRIVWLGDSITQNWQRAGLHDYDDYLPVWERYYAPYQALDFGFKGDTTADLIWRLDHGQVAGLHPQLAIILIGANNFGHVHWDAQMTVPGIESVVRITHRQLPGAHILLLGVLPSIRSPWVDEQTELTNAALARAYAGSNLVTFINLAPLFLTDGRVNAAFYLDPHLTPPDPPLHPDAASMARIASALAPYVTEYVK